MIEGMASPSPKDFWEDNRTGVQGSVIPVIVLSKALVLSLPLASSLYLASSSPPGGWGPEGTRPTWGLWL